MPRPMSSAMLAALQAGQLYPGILVDLQFSTGSLYLWSGTGPITWNGNTYLGMGTFGAISTIEEGADVDAKGVTLTLSGIDSTMLADALQNIRIGLPVTIHFALFNPDGSLIADPLISWSGRTDQPTILISGTEATISLNCESRLRDMNTAVDRRYTLEDSQIDNPGDLGLMFVQGLQEMTIFWGQTAQSTNNI